MARHISTMENGRLKTNLGSGLFVTILTLALLGYLAVSLLLGDPLWVLPPAVDVPPDRIIVYADGRTQTIELGNPLYTDLSTAIADLLRSPRGFETTTGLSERSLRDAYERYVTIEVWYPRPLQLHARFRLINPTRILIPITGRHVNKAFLGTDEAYTVGALTFRESDMQRLDAILQEMGVLDE